METVVSGIRPTGNLHLGNYYGAVRSFVKMQDEFNCLFFIADWHSLTTSPKPEDIKRSARTIMAEYLACGLDPEKATIYLQSDVKEVLELYLFFNMNTYLGELERVTTFKDKARQQPDNVNAGLLTYPTLMAADILQHRAAKVPVGKDQEQNMEMARKCARRFNNIYGVEYFPEPQNYYFGAQALKVPGLDGSVTDAGPQSMNSEKPEVIKNLFTMMSIVSSKETLDYFDEKWNDCTLRYGDMKKQLAEDMVNAISPIRERILEFSAKPEMLDEILAAGGDKARKSAQQTLKDVREIIGFKSF